MRMIRPEELKRLREEYPAGTRVELVQMEDPQAPPVGTKGTVTGADSLGDLLVNWDNHSSLNVVWGVDVVRKLSAMTKTIRKEILQIRASGVTNMLDVVAVQRLAYELEYFDLVCYIAEHRKEYVHFIMTGEAE